MNTRILAVAAALVLTGSGTAITRPAAAQPVPGMSVAADPVGRWLHDSRGETIGSVRSLTDDGRTAVLMIGSYYEPGSHEIRVPAGALSVVGRKVTLRSDVVEALNDGGQQ